MAITAIAVSLIEAYPDKLFKLAYYLVRIPEIIMLDRGRLGKEHTLRTTMQIDEAFQTSLTQIYVEERERAYKAEFRKKLFEHVILKYQIKNDIPKEYKSKLWKLLDEEHKKYEDVTDDDERGILFQRYYIQMDIRRQNFQEYQQGDIHGIVMEPQFDERQNEKLELLEKRRKLQNEKAELSLWVNMRFEENQVEFEKYEKYERNAYLAYEEMVNFEKFSKEYPDLAFMVYNLDLYISCVLIRDFEKNLSLDIIEKCVNKIRCRAMEMLKYPNEMDVSEFSWKGEYELNNIVSEYLLAGAKTWELISLEDRMFWQKCSREYGFHRATLYGIGYFINHIGYELFRDEAIIWIYDIINNNPHLWEVKLLTNTIYYLEKYMEIYCDYHRSEIKRNQTIKTQVEQVLDFLVEKGSTIGFMLRDEL